MKVKTIYKSLLDKSLSSILAAIEIYNKPNFLYREEAFAILSVNAWELLFKAILLKFSGYKMSSLYILQPKVKRDGSSSKRTQPKCNRSGNPLTISITEAVKRLNEKNLLPKTLKDNVEILIELRDNAVHLVNDAAITKQFQELGFACVKNYINYCKEQEVGIDFSAYNLYLMPLAYIDEKKVVSGIFNTETENVLNLISSVIQRNEKQMSEDYDIAVEIELNFKKTNRDGIKMYYDKDGIKVELSEEDVRAKYPLSYKELVEKCKQRYSNFKQGKVFNTIMKGIKQKESLCHERKLDTQNPKSPAKQFYSTNVFQELDKQYTKK